ncbi:unnamed protein product [Leptosia nina]|uniref:Structure-specific endonuclease subunit SLX4 n=1 Tax=Leptosia nina TaxID=320188 RepID=A0AAV1JFT1_9NEOP
MAIGVDTSKWKPRRLQGTPAAKFRNYLGIGILSLGLISGLIFHTIPVTKNLRVASERLYEDPIEEVERKQMIAAGLPNHELNNSASTSKLPVTNKYFSEETALDDSLKEFQEKKKNIAGPKKSKKKPPKKIKLIKGQKDIYSLLKNNDLVAYSKDFDNVCKKSGLDIDSEQLQLAIALSKSIQDTKQTEDVIETKPLSSQERTLKIRTTLQEYGFRVPEVKIADVNKRKRKKKENYKLLTATNEEKQQIIIHKYSKILSENVYKLSDFTTNIPEDTLYYKSTCIPYNDLKSNDIFYVNSLIERCTETVSLLRNWSDIPGRCPSPVFEGPKLGFQDIQCSEDELDMLLSGSISSAQEFLYTKLGESIPKDVLSSSYNQSYPNTDRDEERVLITTDYYLDKTVEEVQANSVDHHMSDSILVNETLSQPHLVSKTCDITKIEITIEESQCESEKSTSVYRERSNSPDLFDDEVCVIGISEKSENTNMFNFTESHETIDLTQCVSSAIRPHFSNRTRRISNDFMDLTECVVKSNSNNDEKIDLTQNFDDDTIVYVHDDNMTINCDGTNSNIVIEDDIKSQRTPVSTMLEFESVTFGLSTMPTTRNETNVEAMDLTQSSDSSDEIPDLIINGADNVGLDNTIVIYDNYKTNSSEANVQDLVCFNITSMGNNAQTSCINNSTTQNLKEVDVVDVDEKVNDKIDLTQTEFLYNEPTITSPTRNYDCLGKKDDKSIDYDEMFDNVIESYSNYTKSGRSSDKRSITSNSSIENKEASTSKHASCEISDQELNDSMKKSEGDNTSDENSNAPLENDQADELPFINLISDNSNETVTPRRKNKNYHIIKTPSNNEYFVKTAEVTPMQNYEAMSSPERNKELEKYGLKPFKRKRAIQMLTYIYNQTHPIVDSCINDSPSPSKKFKMSNTSPPKTTDATPLIKDISCDPEDWIFQKREKAKIHSCKVPLHIAFHNYVTCRRLLREAILCYEPINIDVVHKDLVAIGYRYNPKDLLKFLDKKCITVKTADNNARNKR